MTSHFRFFNIDEREKKTQQFSILPKKIIDFTCS
jgi:hypothetical protein